MRTFLDAKAMAKSLRTSLSQKQITLSNSDCLETVAAPFAFGFFLDLAIVAATKLPASVTSHI